LDDFSREYGVVYVEKIVERISKFGKKHHQVRFQTSTLIGCHIDLQ